ncbi:MAG: hypothetical protein RR400_01405 [Clostridia bacterium]
MKKSIIITSFVLIVSIISLIIVGSFTYKDFSKNIAKPDNIIIQNESGNATSSEGSTVKGFSTDELYAQFTKSSKVNYLTGFFTGGLSKDAKINKTALNKFVNTSKIVVTFVYYKEQTMMLNGKKYVDETNSSLNDIKYNELKFIIEEKNGLSFNKIYVMETKDPTTYKYCYSQYMNLDSFYKHLKDIKEFENPNS